MTHAYMCHDTFIYATGASQWCVIHKWDTTSAPYLCAPWLIYACAMTQSFVLPWLIHTCAMTHSYLFMTNIAGSSHLPYPIGRQPVHQGHVCQDSFIRVPWLMHVCAMTHIAGASQCFAIHNWDTTWAPQSILAGRAYTSYLGYSGVPWLFHMCAMTHSYVCHDSLICVPWLIAYTGFLSHSGVLWLFHVCHDSFIYMPWLIQTMTHFIH